MSHFAHSSNRFGMRQVLEDHLKYVARHAQNFATPLHAQQLAYSAGLLHDIGKYHPAFQKYLCEAEQPGEHRNHGPDHKGAGAVLALQMGIEVLAFLIAGHHGGLPDRKHLKLWLQEKVQDGQVQEAICIAQQELTLSDFSSSPTHLFPAHVQIAKQTGFSEDDLALFWQALQYAWDFDHTAARGMLAFRGAYVFSHENPRGNVHAHKLLERVTARLVNGCRTPRGISDYAFAADTDQLPKGITFTPLESLVAV